MIIYIPSFISENPFITQLVNSLLLNDDVDDVLTGIELFKKDEIIYDIILFQWPEVLLHWKLPNDDDLLFLKKKIKLLKDNQVKIIATVHNLFPHKGCNLNTENLYRLIYENCDRIVHLGKSSKKIFKETVGYSIEESKEVVIKHGNYNYFENKINNENARELFRIMKGKFVLLSFGHIRNIQEFKLILKVADYLKKRNGLVLISGKLFEKNKKRLRYYLLRIPLYIRKNIIFKDGFVNDSEVQNYLNACDSLFIPRSKSLNSGNVALGFTFGKVVIGENFGVIGEELTLRNNPTFDLKIEKSVEKSIDRAIILSKTDIGKRNKEYSQTELSWETISNSYVSLFKSI